MGSPLSPAMAIATTAWMEMKWRRGLQPDMASACRAKRFMDDVLFMYKGEAGARALSDFRQGCYDAPLRLEETAPDTFLETFFVGGCTTTHRLKNVNERCEDGQAVWRYQRYSSYTPYLQKFGVIMCTLKKVDHYASDEQQRMVSGRLKLREFRNLGYPEKVLKIACIKTYGATWNRTWLEIARAFGTGKDDFA